MRKIKLFEDFLEDDLELSEMDKNRIREWVKKYEKYFDFHNTDSFFDSAEQMAKDCVEQLGMPKNKLEVVQDYLSSLRDLSDGLSVIMSPGPEIINTGIDQLTRFQY